MKTLTNQKILDLLNDLGLYFAAREETVEIALYGGAALVLKFNLRDATHDIDMTPISDHREALMAAAGEMAATQGLPEDWLNDHVEIFTSTRPEFDIFGDFPRADGAALNQYGLRVLTARPAYVFAMKVLAMRNPFESSDMKDIWDLMDKMGIESLDSARDCVLRFYPDTELPRRTEIILDDLLEARANGEEYSPMLGW